MSRSKIEFGNVKVSFASAVDYGTFPGQEYMCTEKAKGTYLCEKLIFGASPDWPGAIDLGVL